VTVFAAEVPVSPLVLFDAVTVNVFTGCPFPANVEFSIRPLIVCPAVPAVIVKVSVSPLPPPCTNWLVTVSPLGAVIDSKSGTPLIVTDTVSSESVGDAVIPKGFDPPAGTVREEGAVRVGGSGPVSASDVVVFSRTETVLPSTSDTTMSGFPFPFEIGNREVQGVDADLLSRFELEGSVSITLEDRNVISQVVGDCDIRYVIAV
jgi:hypothetical protein